MERWEMVGRWLEDGWKNTCFIRTPTTNKFVSTTQNHIMQIEQQNKMAGWLALAISKTILMYI